MNHSIRDMSKIRFIGKIERDNQTGLFKGSSQKYFTNNLSDVSSDISENIESQNLHTISSTDIEETKFNNLLQTMGGRLFDKNKNYHYYVAQFSTSVIKKGLTNLTQHPAPFNSVMNVLSNFWGLTYENNTLNLKKSPREEFKQLPLPVQKWFLQCSEEWLQKKNASSL